MLPAVIILALLGLAVAAAVRLAYRKQLHIILLRDRDRPREAADGLRHVFFCFCDHFEPLWKGADRERGLERVLRWRDGYPRCVEGLVDRGGRQPRHAFFYPQEEYAPEYLDPLAELERRGLAAVELHLHHDNDTSDGFR